jgi:hypothetical protein
MRRLLLSLGLLALAVPAFGQSLALGFNTYTALTVEAHTPSVKRVSLWTHSSLAPDRKTPAEDGYRWRLSGYVGVDVWNNISAFVGCRNTGYRLTTWRKSDTLCGDGGVQWQGAGRMARYTFLNSNGLKGDILDQEVAGAHRLRYSHVVSHGFILGATLDFLFWTQNGVDGSDTAVSLDIGYGWDAR